MKVIVFGATGMVGQGVLRECLLASDVEQVIAPVRSKTQQSDRKLLEMIQADMMDVSPIASELATGDACFFCLGVSSAGMSEADYTRLTHDLTLSVGRELAKVNPAMTFIYVSGQGTDASEKGRTMWARVKGKTENDLLELPFKAAYMFRPGFIQPLHGIKSKTPLYRAVYSLMGFLAPLAKWVAPGSITDTEKVGKAMLAVARNGSAKKISRRRTSISSAAKSASVILDRGLRAITPTPPRPPRPAPPAPPPRKHAAPMEPAAGAGSVTRRVSLRVARSLTLPPPRPQVTTPEVSQREACGLGRSVSYDAVVERFRAALFAAAFTACNAPERALPDAGPEKAAEFRGIATAPSSATQSSSGAPRAVMPFSAADRARMQAVVDSLGDAGGMSPAAHYLVRQIPGGLPTDADLSALLDICESRGDRDCAVMARAEMERRRQVESTYHPGLTPSAAVDSGHSN